MIDEIMKQKQCVCRADRSNNNSNRRNRHKTISIVSALSIKAINNRIFSDVFLFLIINTNLMFIRIINNINDYQNRDYFNYQSDYQNQYQYQNIEYDYQNKYEQNSNRFSNANTL